MYFMEMTARASVSMTSHIAPYVSPVSPSSFFDKRQAISHVAKPTMIKAGKALHSKSGIAIIKNCIEASRT